MSEVKRPYLNAGTVEPEDVEQADVYMDQLEAENKRLRDDLAYVEVLQHVYGILGRPRP
jgi:hypothetical protein